jgi:cytochrome bd-type quinol oxidase subunit 1
MTTPVAAFIGHLTAGRAQMGTSLAFHLTFAVLGVGLPLMMLIAEGLHLRTGDPVWRSLAVRWSKAFAILFAVGAVSGTIISFELGLLFPRFMAFAGGIIGLPFSLEGFAFFIEASFLGIYLYGWKRLSPRTHWLAGFPVAISGIAFAMAFAPLALMISALPPASAVCGAGGLWLAASPWALGYASSGFAPGLRISSSGSLSS